MKNEPKSISEVCPNCIEFLILEKKKLGGMTNWFICPVCGYKERPANKYFITKNTGRFTDNIKASNKRMSDF